MKTKPESKGLSSPSPSPEQSATRAEIDRLLAVNPSVQFHISGSSLDTMPEADLRIFLKDLRYSLGIRMRPMTAADRHPQEGDILRYFRYPMRFIIGVETGRGPIELKCEQVDASDFTRGTGQEWRIIQWKHATYEQRADGGPVEIEVPDEDDL